MDILYVNPGKLMSGLDPLVKNPPLNLMTLAAMVPEHGARLLDFKVDTYDEQVLRAELSRADVVAITSLTPQIYAALDVARIAKELGVVTIIGGYHATLDPEFVAKDPAVDVVVRGEGEHTFRELIDFFDGNPYHVELKDIDGISFKQEDGSVLHTKPRALECNLDIFPLPRRDLMKGKEKYYFMGARADVVETSRGCPHHCKFCCIAKMWEDHGQGVSYRYKSLKRILEDIEHVAVNNKEYIFFSDDNFTINPGRVKQILEGIIESKVARKLHYGCQSRVDTLYENPWLVKLMSKSKFRQVFLGIESLHQQSLDAMNKVHTTPAKAKKVVEMLSKEGISVYGGMIIAFPGETREMVYQNIQFAKSLKLSMMQFTPITAFPGTEFYEEMKAKGMITSTNYLDYDLFHTMMKTEQLSAEEIYGLMKEAYAACYLDHDYIKQQAKQFLNPFGKWRWLFRKLPYVIKHFLIGGSNMLGEQGITKDIISDELRNTKLPDFADVPAKPGKEVEANAPRATVQPQVIENKE
nr:radical SAM protein [Candidatus Sigynarchaeota archaeon]